MTRSFDSFAKAQSLRTTPLFLKTAGSVIHRVWINMWITCGYQLWIC